MALIDEITEITFGNLLSGFTEVLCFIFNFIKKCKKRQHFKFKNGIILLGDSLCITVLKKLKRLLIT